MEDLEVQTNNDMKELLIKIEEYGLTNEVKATAFDILSESPTLKLNEALEMAAKEWDVE